MKLPRQTFAHGTPTEPTRSCLPRHIPGAVAAVDLGGTNFDVLVARDGLPTRQRVPAKRPAGIDSVRAAIAAAGVHDPRELRWIAVTGGPQRQLPDTLDGVPLLRVDELRAIGLGGLAAAGLREALVVSMGTGTAMVGARNGVTTHFGGSGVGGGTLLGLGQLLLGTSDPLAIDAAALAGDANACDITVGDIVGGPVGTIPADATAAHFGKAANPDASLRRADVAAALLNLIGQATIRLALLTARAQGYSTVVLIGHLADLDGIHRAATALVTLFGGEIVVAPEPGFSVALGALMEAASRAEAYTPV